MISPHCRIELAVVGKMTIRIKDGIMSENTGNLQIFIKSIPKHYLKLLHPEYYGIDKVSFLNFFDYTGFINLNVVQIDF